jgi:hypothetical protein
MFLVPTKLRPSYIHGTGVFLQIPVHKGELIARFDPRIDRIYTETEVAALPQVAQDLVRIYGGWHEQKREWLLYGDNLRFCNHNENPSMVVKGEAFDEAIAARDLKIDDELTWDYRQICNSFLRTGRFHTPDNGMVI